jgi:hypothetical protein
MSVHDLISAARKNSQALKLTAEALADLKKVLAANDRAGNKFQRVTLAAFASYLAKQYKVKTSTSALADYVKRELGRGWAK